MILLLGSLVAVAGILLGDHRPDWTLVISGLVLASGGLLRIRRRESVRAGTAWEIGSVGALLAGVGIACTLAPLICFALHDWALGAITSPGLLIGWYFAFLGYGLLWTATIRTDPPFAKEFRAASARWARRLSRPL